MQICYRLFYLIPDSGITSNAGMHRSSHARDWNDDLW